MDTVYIQPSKLQGLLIAPPSKSHTLRALYFALMSGGTCKIDSPLLGKDTQDMINAITQLGAQVEHKEHYLLVKGVGGQLKAPKQSIDAGNSGIIYRFLAALCSLSSHTTTLTGDNSIKERRPIMPLLKALDHIGVKTKAATPKGGAPISVQGPWQHSKVTIDGQDSQPVTALIYAAAFSNNALEVEIENMKEKPWINLSLSWLDRLNIPYQRPKEDKILVSGQTKLAPFQITIPGDFSSAATFLALGVLQNSSLTIENLDLNDMQGDKVIVKLLQKMGAQFDMDPKANTVRVLPRSTPLKAIDIDVDQCIDLIPLLALVGTQCEGTTHLYNGAIARSKECDRIDAISSELSKMGAKLSSTQETLTISPSTLKGASLKTHSDHRMAMTLCAASLIADGPSTLDCVSCTQKTYPHFFQEIERLGGLIEYRTHRL